VLGLVDVVDVSTFVNVSTIVDVSTFEDVLEVAVVVFVNA
jgi:hypothetical protein